MDQFTIAYIECALWSSTDNDGEPLDDNYTINDLHTNTLSQMVSDCKSFQKEQCILLTGLDKGQCGHDFWLTRNRHGAGFWDRGLGTLGEHLTNAAQAYGEVWLIVGNDDLIHC